jgi:hypothetical protein
MSVPDADCQLATRVVKMLPTVRQFAAMRDPKGVLLVFPGRRSSRDASGDHHCELRFVAKHGRFGTANYGGPSLAA